MDRCSIFLLCWMYCFPGVEACATESTWQATFLDDATLDGVVFVDVEHGWAVGNHGAVWHTTDGGQRWQRQTSPFPVNLRSVHFADKNLGWIVGGSTSPYLWASRATVFRTTDSGKTWEPQLALLPALERVKFFDQDHGVAWGRGSGGEPFGVFASDDSGRNWRPVTVGWQSAWSAGDFANQHTGIVVGEGRAARITNGDPAPLDFGRHPIRAVRIGSSGIWAVGDHGTILHSSDGSTWNTADVLPDDLSTLINWQSVATHGSHVWIVGSPGSVVLHSADGGKSWQGHATGTEVPLREITFIDDKNGWAVGDLGTILHTTDGGATWQVQRRGGESVAVLVIATHPDRIPFEALAKLASDGYRTAVHLFEAENKQNPPTQSARLREALSSVGCTAFSCSTPEVDGLSEQLALQLRMWRPAVLVVPGGNDIYEHATDSAIKQAADAGALPHIGDQLALHPWQVSRVFAHLPPGQRGTHRVQSADIVPMADQSLGELATAARSLLNCEFRAPSETNEFLLMASHAGEPTLSVEDLAAGLSIQPGSDCRRSLPAVQALADPQTQRRLAEKRRNLSNIFRFAQGNPALMAQVGQMMGDLAPGAAAALLIELAEQFAEAGEMQLAVDTRELLVRRSAGYPLADHALVWLVQFYASSETAHAYRHVATEITEAPTSESLNSAVQTATALLETETDEMTNSFTRRRYERAVQYAEYVAKNHPLLNTETVLRVPAAIAERRLGTSESAQRYLESLSLRYPGEAWQQCGIVERWLSNPDNPAPAKTRITCRFTGERPKLNGQLDEPVWQVKTIELSAPPSETTNPKSALMLSHDEEYLYLAVRCEKTPLTTYTAASDARSYDADLSEQDRVRILIDLDRDYTTYFALTVDHRGWTNDACWQDKSWNPKWFVAAAGDEQTWSVEAAIPWSELTESPPKIGDAWAVAVERVVPGDSSQTLTGVDASETGPAQFGVLLFK